MLLLHHIRWGRGPDTERLVPPKRPPPRSRFVEGSMTDRASAMPPLQFLGPTVPLSPSSCPPCEAPKLSLTNVWGGVCEKLGLRDRHATEADDALFAYRDRHATEADDALYAYRDLVAAGFFSSQAIQSTRWPASQNWPLPESRGLKRTQDGLSASGGASKRVCGPGGAKGVRRSVSAGQTRARGPVKIKRPSSVRNLRQRVLGERADVNAGVAAAVEGPKFTFGEDRENGGPWRGLRR